MQLLVLGMHRSGTSSVTRLLNMAGAYFGPEGISNGADEGNPKGFWERLDVRDACDGLLAGGGFDWWRLSGFSVEAIPDDVRERHVAELRRIVLELDAHRPWVVKEPRLCLLLPLLRPLLEIPVCVHVVREPLEVAESLRTRNGFTVQAGLALWELYSVHAFRASSGLPRVLVRYDELVGAPVDTVRSLVHELRELGVDLLRVPSDREILAFITPQLHRERSSSERRGEWMNAHQLRLAAAVDDGSILDDDSVVTGVSEGALDSLAEFERELDRRARADDVEAHLREADATLQEVERRVRTIAHSKSWRIGSNVTSVRRKLSRGDSSHRSDPFEAVLDGLERARRDAELGSADEAERPPSEAVAGSREAGAPAPAPGTVGASPSRSTRRPRVAVLAWDVGHNPLGRAHLLAGLLHRSFDTEIWGAQFPRYGTGTWAPLRDSRIPINVFPGREFPAHFDEMCAVAERIDADAIYVSKPRLPSYALGVLAKQASNRPLVLDVDDHELSFFGDAPGLDLHDVPGMRRDPTFSLPFDRLWTQVCDPLVDAADALTVSNDALRERYGGVVVPHARDERVFDPARHDRAEARRRLGVSEEARVLLFGGTPRVHKGVVDLLRALERLGDERYRLLLFGSRELEAMRDEIGELARWVLTVPSPRFDDLPGVLAAADVACVLQDPDHAASRYQFPAKVVDALAMRVPCLVRPVAPLRPLVERGVLEVLAPDEPLHERIERLFDRYDDAADRARIGRKVFEEEYSFEAVGEVVAPLFRQLLEDPPDLSPRLAELTDVQRTLFAPGRERVRRPARVPGRRRRDVSPGGRYDVAVFWKQNDSGLYGRRQDMFVEYLARSGRVRTIVHFDLPTTPEDVARQYIRSRGRTDQGRLVANHTLRRVLRLDDSDGVHAYTFLHAGAITRRLGLRSRDGYADWVRRVLARHGFGECPTIVWAYPTNDDLPELIDVIDPDLVVTDVVDDHRTFAPRGSARHAEFERNYREVLARSDLVIANCEPVARSMQELAPVVHVVPNGLELRDGVARPPRPKELRRVPRPIIGYVGNLSQRIDVRLLKRVVRSRPDWQFVFVGSAHHDQSVLDLDYRKNVHFVGVKRYDETLAFIEHFDVAMVPHLDNEMTRSMNPLKAFVYCSTGVPVVSTPVANLDELAGLITVADGPDAFVAAIEDALRRGRRPPDRARLAPHSWDARVARVMDLVDDVAGAGQAH